MITKVSEIFGPTIQGEGPYVGLPTTFVRTGGCDFRCSWCDTPHAVLSEHRHDWTPMTEEEIADKVDDLCWRPHMVTISGGNPAIQDLGPLVDALHALSNTVLVETQGSVAPYWFQDVDDLVLSPKPPSSGMVFDHGSLGDCLSRAGGKRWLKIVVGTPEDFDFARLVIDDFRPLVDGLFLTPLNLNPVEDFSLTAVLEHTKWLVDAVREAELTDVRVIPQVHTLLWGNERGV